MIQLPKMKMKLKLVQYSKDKSSEAILSVANEIAALQLINHNSIIFSLLSPSA